MRELRECHRRTWWLRLCGQRSQQQWCCPIRGSRKSLPPAFRNYRGDWGRLGQRQGWLGRHLDCRSNLLLPCGALLRRRGERVAFSRRRGLQLRGGLLLQWGLRRRLLLCRLRRGRCCLCLAGRWGLRRMRRNWLRMAGAARLFWWM